MCPLKDNFKRLRKISVELKGLQPTAYICTCTHMHTYMYIYHQKAHFNQQRVQTNETILQISLTKNIKKYKNKSCLWYSESCSIAQCCILSQRDFPSPKGNPSPKHFYFWAVVSLAVLDLLSKAI